jgi:hypothetical protein
MVMELAHAAVCFWTVLYAIGMVDSSRFKRTWLPLTNALNNPWSNKIQHLLASRWRKAQPLDKYYKGFPEYISCCMPNYQQRTPQPLGTFFYNLGTFFFSSNRRICQSFRPIPTHWLRCEFDPERFHLLVGLTFSDRAAGYGLRCSGERTSISRHVMLPSPCLDAKFWTAWITVEYCSNFVFIW